MTWQIIIQKTHKGDIDFIYSGDVNLYEVLGLLEVELEKIKKQLLDSVKDKK